MPVQEIRRFGGVPVVSWGIDVEQPTWDQMRNIADLPFAHDHVAMMPDAHPGYAMPIGGVLAADEHVVPYAIGVDIGCGVTLMRIEADAAAIGRDDVARLMERVRASVPVGNGPRGNHARPGDPWRTDCSARIARFAAAAACQLGTLGGGNHFLELQEGMDDGRMYFMIHSGSRSLGKRTCDLHVSAARDFARASGITLPHKDVAYLPVTSVEGRAYLEDMAWCMEWAAENRRRMAAAVRAAVASAWSGVDASVILDCHHNFAAVETHGARELVIHRKGAVRARSEDTVLIPGSMSTGSFIGQGLGNADAFHTCQHGAGRRRSRAATRKLLAGIGMDELMDGVYLSSPGDVRDEASPAYKDIFAVMAASSDLVRPLQQLRPRGVVKG
jgi:tRNA-splicing ligase RtcB